MGCGNGVEGREASVKRSEQAQVRRECGMYIAAVLTCLVLQLGLVGLAGPRAAPLMALLLAEGAVLTWLMRPSALLRRSREGRARLALMALAWLACTAFGPSALPLAAPLETLALGVGAALRLMLVMPLVIWPPDDPDGASAKRGTTPDPRSSVPVQSAPRPTGFGSRFSTACRSSEAVRNTP